MDAKNGTITLTFTGDIKDLTNKMNSIQKNMGNLSKETSGFGEKIVSGFSKAASSLKGITLSMVGIYSTYRMLSKASSAYLAQDQETSRKIQAAWIGLGAMFAPLLEKIGTFVITAVKYLNVFIKALFGIDLIARANAKSFGKAAKAANSYKGALMGIDEITNVEIQTGGAGGMGADDFNWLDEFDKVELDPTIVKWLEQLAGFIKENWKGLAIGLGAVAGALLLFKGLHTVFSFVDKMLQMAETSKKLAALTGVKGLAGTIIGLIGVLTTIVGVIGLVASTLDALNTGSLSSFFAIISTIAIVVGGIAVALGALPIAIGALGVALVAGIASWGTYDASQEKVKGTIKELIKGEERLTQLQDIASGALDSYTAAVDRHDEALRRVNELTDEQKIKAEELYQRVQANGEAYFDLTEEEKRLYKIQGELVKSTDNLTQETEGLRKANKDVVEQEKKNEESKKRLLKQGMENKKGLKLEKEEYDIYKAAVIEAYEKGEISAKKASDLISKSMKGMSTDTQKTYTKDIPDAIKNGLEPSKYQSWADKFRNWWGKFWGGIKGEAKVEAEISTKTSSSKGYALGLQEVPHDMVTTVHKGEAIVPAKFNKDSYFNGQPQYASDNSDVVAAVQYLTDVLIRKDMSVNIDRKDIGNIAIEHINSETRRLGMGVI